MVMKKRTFTSPKANLPKFPYSQAVIYGDQIFVSAQPPVDPDTGELDGDDVKAQTRRILTNIPGLLEDAGTSLEPPPARSLSRPPAVRSRQTRKAIPFRQLQTRQRPLLPTECP